MRGVRTRRTGGKELSSDVTDDSLIQVDVDGASDRGIILLHDLAPPVTYITYTSD